MKTFATLTAAVGLLGALAAATPASAAVGQCFDAYGRPFGPPHNTDNPPYGMICQAYRAGGHCTHVQPQWAVSNCGLAPRGYYHRGYDYDDYDYRPRYRSHRYYNRSDYYHGYRRGQSRRDHDIRYYLRAKPSGTDYLFPGQLYVPERPVNTAR